MPAAIDLTGLQFYYLTVVQKHQSEDRQTKWLCQCYCGNTKVVETRNLTGELVKSCGCLSDTMRSMSNLGHDLARGPTNKTWKMMKQRCTNEKYTHYNYYGAKGITYDPNWETFEGFVSDMGERPEGTTLDRIENDKGYFKDNCRWVDKETQLENRSNTLHFEYKGQTKTLLDWSRVVGVERSKLYAYMYRHDKFDLYWLFNYLNLDI